MKVQFYISSRFARTVALVLGSIVAGLTALSLLVQFLSFYLSSLTSQIDSEDGRLDLFNLPSDGNIPQWYSSSMLLICSILLAIIAVAAKNTNYRFHWTGLSLIFLYLSADEAASLHEKVSTVLEGQLNTGGILHYAWVLPYGFIVLVFAMVYFKFVLDLPARTRLLFVIAGVLFVGGAIGAEMITAYYADTGRRESLTYYLVAHVEEVLEMLGVVVFIYALLLYISVHARSLNIGSEDPEAGTQSTLNQQK